MYNEFYDQINFLFKYERAHKGIFPEIQTTSITFLRQIYSDGLGLILALVLLHTIWANFGLPYLGLVSVWSSLL